MAKTFIAKDKSKTIKFLSESVYGYMPSRPEHLRGALVAEDSDFCGGEALIQSIDLILTLEGEEVKLPIKLTMPSGDGKFPTFIHINYRADVPDKFLPAEEIAERGFAVFSLCYKDICGEERGFDSGIARKIVKMRKRKDSPGKIALWSWGILRVIDFALNQPFVDGENIAVIGHGILAKSVMLAGGIDERIKYVILNNSTFGNTDLLLKSPELYCPRFQDIDEIGHDEMTLSLCAGKYIMIGSGAYDCFTDRKAELNAIRSIAGDFGILPCDALPEDKAILSRGKIMHLTQERKAFLGRREWNAYMDFIDSVMGKK